MAHDGLLDAIHLGDVHAQTDNHCASNDGFDTPRAPAARTADYTAALRWCAVLSVAGSRTRCRAEARRYKIPSKPRLSSAGYALHRTDTVDWKRAYDSHQSKAGVAKARSGGNKTPTRADDPGWSVRRSAGIELLQADALAKIPWLVHGFSTRQGGDSRLDGQRVLNLGFTDWDARAIVTRNRGKLLRAVGAAEMPLIALRQIHSDVAYVFPQPTAEPCRGDAAITQAPGLLLSVQTADCVPILLVDKRQRVVAAVHAGWRGTLARVAAKTLGRMRFEFGTRPQTFSPRLGRRSAAAATKSVRKSRRLFRGSLRMRRSGLTDPSSACARARSRTRCPGLP